MHRLKIRKYFLTRLIILVCLSSALMSQPGILRVGFDIDDTILYSRKLFENAPRHSEGKLDYGWINSHDRDYSLLIEPMAVLARYFHIHGHEVYFITARGEENGSRVAEFLADVLGFEISNGKNLFFSPKETIQGRRFTTKHRVMQYLDLDIFYGDSDMDMIAAIKADVQPVRIIRHHSSVEQYGSNYFGNTLDGSTPGAPFTADDLSVFYRAKVGIFGESIYPIIWDGPSD